LDISRIPPTHRRIFLPASSVNTGALRLAIEDVIVTYGKRYPKGPEYLKRLTVLETEHAAAQVAVKAEAAKKAAAPKEEKKADAPPAPTPAEVALQNAANALAALQSEALLSHPLLDFEKLLFVRRGVGAPATSTTAAAEAARTPTSASSHPWLRMERTLAARRPT